MLTNFQAYSFSQSILSSSPYMIMQSDCLLRADWIMFVNEIFSHFTLCVYTLETMLCMPPERNQNWVNLAFSTNIICSAISLAHNVRFELNFLGEFFSTYVCRTLTPTLHFYRVMRMAMSIIVRPKVVNSQQRNRKTTAMLLVNFLTLPQNYCTATSEKFFSRCIIKRVTFYLTVCRVCSSSEKCLVENTNLRNQLCGLKLK